MSNTTFSTIKTIETRNWNRRLSPRNMSIIYDLVDVWHRRIDSTIQMLSSNTPTTDSNPDTNGIYQCDIQDNIGSIKYQYIMDEEGKNALYVLHIDFNLPWNLGSGRLNIRENKQNITMKNTKKKIRLTESQLYKLIKESVKRVLTEARYSKYKHSENPLLTKEEAEYWDNLEFPDDKEYSKILAMTKTMDYSQLYDKLGHDKFSAFIMRLSEDDTEYYNEYYYCDPFNQF